MVKISVIIPVYNTGAAALKLLKVLLPQVEAVGEVILVDDGSTDNSLALLKKSAKGCVKVISQENQGAAAARNAGINISQGEYLCFLDSDDLVTDDYIKKMVSAMDENPDAVVTVCGIRFNKLALETSNDAYISRWRKRRNREKLGDYVMASMVYDGRMYSSVNKIYRGDIVRKTGVKLEEGRDFAEDTKFVLDYLSAGFRSRNYSSGDIIFIPEALYIYNFGTDTSTVKKSSTVWENWQRQFRDTLDFARETGGIGIRTMMLAGVLRLRWRVSWWRARGRE